jgi:hypothetical protein
MFLTVIVGSGLTHPGSANFISDVGQPNRGAGKPAPYGFPNISALSLAPMVTKYAPF